MTALSAGGYEWRKRANASLTAASVTVVSPPYGHTLSAVACHVGTLGVDGGGRDGVDWLRIGAAVTSRIELRWRNGRRPSTAGAAS